MLRTRPLISKTVCTLTGIILFICSNAQEPTPAKAGSDYNVIMIVMIFVASLLAFVIWGLGQVLVTLARQALNKNRLAEKIFTVLMIIYLCGSSLVTSAQPSSATTASVNITQNYGGMTSTGFWTLISVIVAEVTVIGFMLFGIRKMQTELIPQRAVRPWFFKEWWSRMDKKLFTRAVAVEREADILLDHDYDGIKELDNALPPWWKYGFMLTIMAAFIYLLNFHVLGYGKNPTEEYQQELVKAQEQKELYEAKNADKVDELNIRMPSAAGLNAGRQIFTTTCWACHGKSGEGGAGPNLTDDYWLHKGSLTDVYQSIKQGYPDKGMQAWEKSFSQKDINNIAGYIKTLRGTKPLNAKAPQGDLFTEKITTDSLSAPLSKQAKNI